MVTKFKNYAAKSTVEWEYPDQCFLREVDPARSSVFKSPGKNEIERNFGISRNHG